MRGGEALSMTHHWTLVNGILDDGLNRKAGEELAPEANEARGMLMVMLTLIMLNGGKIRESELATEMEKHLNVPSGVTESSTSAAGAEGSSNVLSLVKKFHDEGYLKRATVKDSFEPDGKAVVIVRWGARAELEVGKRSALIFATTVAKVELTDSEELELMGLKR